MKKILILAIALISISAIAQKRENPERTDLTAEQSATLQTKRLTLALDLNTSQQTQVQALHIEQSKVRIAKKQERKNNKAAKDTKKPNSEERYAMQTAKLDQQIAHKGKMKKILSTDQYERWEKMTKRRGKKKRKGRKGKNKE